MCCTKCSMLVCICYLCCSSDCMSICSRALLNSPGKDLRQDYCIFRHTQQIQIVTAMAHVQPGGLNTYHHMWSVIHS